MGHRFFVDSPITSIHAVLLGSEAHHLQHVLRGRVGDEVVLLDGSGHEFLARVTCLARSHVELLVLESRLVDRELPHAIVVGVALPKADRQRWLVEKLVELGVARVVPLRTRRGVVLPDARSLLKLQRSVREASKQCGRTRLLEVAPLVPLVDYLQTAPASASKWIADPAGSLLVSIPGGASGYYLAVGPEGGWAEDELALARTAGWHAVSLGARMLRIETACLVLAALLSQAETAGADTGTAPPPHTLPPVPPRHHEN
jgi:16S rRNA (uracil1498-N3)-methyltransferase